MSGTTTSRFTQSNDSLAAVLFIGHLGGRETYLFNERANRMTMERNDFGVIAYRPRPDMPLNNEAHFDGWFAVRDWAEHAFEEFRRGNPDHIVHLVTRVRSEWRDGG